LGGSGKALVLRDGSDRYGFVSTTAIVRPTSRTMKMTPYGGFVMVIDED
jgi:hypothetical protein